MISSIKNEPLKALIAYLLNGTLSGFLSFPSYLTVNWISDAILEIIPNRPWQEIVLISAGIHGNETAPIEILLQLLQKLANQTQPLDHALLIVFGNIPAMRLEKRYVAEDMNRLFQKQKTVNDSAEARRVIEIETAIQSFLAKVRNNVFIPCTHLDMHTAIRDSYFKQFAMIPFHQHPYRQKFSSFLNASGIDAVVRHTQKGKTFSHYTSEVWNMESCTLELGKVRRFGQNDEKKYSQIQQVLSELLAGKKLSTRQKPEIRHFAVADTVIKENDEFTLNLASDISNFTCLPEGYELAHELKKTRSGNIKKIWKITAKAPYILFPNANVQSGQRACLMLRSVTSCQSLQG